MSITNRFAVMTTLLIGADWQFESEQRKTFKDDDMILLSRATPELLDRIQEARLPIIQHRHGTLAKLNLGLGERWTH